MQDKVIYLHPEKNCLKKQALLWFKNVIEFGYSIGKKTQIKLQICKKKAPTETEKWDVNQVSMRDTLIKITK